MLTHAIARHALAELLLERCGSAKLKKKVWAKSAGVSEQSWSKYTRGSTMPGIETFTQIATELFNQPAEDLLEAVCVRMGAVARRGLVRDREGQLVPAGKPEAHRPATVRQAERPYAFHHPGLELDEPRAARDGDSLSLDGLHPESAEVLRALHRWLAARDRAT